MSPIFKLTQIQIFLLCHSSSWRDMVYSFYFCPCDRSFCASLSPGGEINQKHVWYVTLMRQVFTRGSDFIARGNTRIFTPSNFRAVIPRTELGYTHGISFLIAVLAHICTVLQDAFWKGKKNPHFPMVWCAKRWTTMHRGKFFLA